MSKFIFVVGGVYSGTGKGISAASLGLLLKMRGSTVAMLKCDPYLNLNAGTLGPREHGETFLCDDGSECDLDLGHYERITGTNVSAANIFTSGAIYKELLEEEEQGKYLGDTVQVVPHVTNKLIQKWNKVGKDVDVVIAEIGGTVGDFESFGFYEAIRQFKQQTPENVMIVMVSPVIWNGTVKEFKTKPLQNSVRELQRFGLVPELLLCRCDREIPEQILEKISRMSGVPQEAVFEAPDVKTIYQVPIEFWKRHIDDLVADKFHLRRTGCRIHKYKDLVEAYIDGQNRPEVTIGVVGKYGNSDEAYLSLREALFHAAVSNNVRMNIRWLLAEELEGQTSLSNSLSDLHGVIVPGGFDSRGVSGKINAIWYCRENKIPFLGICLGLQCSVIEAARNCLGLPDADSQEFNKLTPNPVVHYIEGQASQRKKSGTMRLGSYDCDLERGSLVRELYEKKSISERHRHRYEVNGAYIEQFEKIGFLVSGKNPQSGLVEMMELRQELHPFFVGTQAHPEFKSKLGNPAPLFDGLVKAAAQRISVTCPSSKVT